VLKKNRIEKMAASAIAVTAALLLTGCGNLPEQRASTPANSAAYLANTPYNASSNTSYYGVVDSIQVIPGEPASGDPGVGAIVGGVVGGILGNQVGGGTGKSVAAVAGVVGGAVVGNQVDKRNRVQAADSHQVSLRLNSGNYQTFQRDEIADLRPGSRVRVENGRLYPY